MSRENGSSFTVERPGFTQALKALGRSPMMMDEEERNRKRVFIVLGAVGLLIGTIVFWLMSPVIFKSMAMRDKDDTRRFYDELSASQDATLAEQEYLDEVNKPVEIGDMDMDDSSLALIKGVRGSESKSDMKSEPAPKISTYDGLRKKVAGALNKMSGFSFGSRGGMGSYGGSGRDYSSDMRRFAKDSNFKGGNVATGPSASGTKLGGSGKRQASFDPRSDQLASSAQKKFEGEMAKPVDPKAAAAGLAGSIPKELRDPSRDTPEKLQPDIPNNQIRSREKDPCAGVQEISGKEATTQLLTGLAFSALGYFLSGAGGASSTVEYTEEKAKVTGIKSQTTGGNQALGSAGSSIMGQGTNMVMQGVMGFVDPESRVRECRQGASRSGSSGASASGGGH